MAQLVFLTLFLGLTSGIHSVALQADPAVASIRLELNGKTIGTMRNAPWSRLVDFGPDVRPQKLVAVALDSQGAEIARAVQMLNLPRQPAELEIILHGGDGRPLIAELMGKHRAHTRPVKAKLQLDGKGVAVGRDFRAQLPKLDDARPHILSAEMRFDDGIVARREGVVQGGFADFVTTQMTPFAVALQGEGEPVSLDGCFSAAGSPVRATAIEKKTALVILVKDPDNRAVLDTLHPSLISAIRPQPSFNGDTSIRIIWPISQPFSAPGEPTYNLFPPTGDFSGWRTGMLSILARCWTLGDPGSEKREVSEAVAVAGVNAAASGQRRAVILLLDRAPDASGYEPGTIRRYLQQIGVPLFVWSVEGPRPDLTMWGEVEDVSTIEKVRDAVARVRDALEMQRIVWIATDPFTALTVRADDRCHLKPLASQ